jgi:hypothetical protein
MIDIETVGTGPEACILTIAAQCFDPLEKKDYDQLQSFYCRVDIDSQSNRKIEQSTIDWWATQPEPAREEAFNEHNRIPLEQALNQLHKIVWHCKRVWANGPTFDMNILEHAFKSYNIALPWKYYNVRDARTIYSLWPDLKKYPASHHALEDCRRQIDLLYDTLDYFKIKAMV